MNASVDRRIGQQDSGCYTRTRTISFRGSKLHRRSAEVDAAVEGIELRLGELNKARLVLSCCRDDEWWSAPSAISLLLALN